MEHQVDVSATSEVLGSTWEDRLAASVYKGSGGACRECGKPITGGQQDYLGRHVRCTPWEDYRRTGWQGGTPSEVERRRVFGMKGQARYRGGVVAAINDSPRFGVQLRIVLQPYDTAAERRWIEKLDADGAAVAMQQRAAGITPAKRVKRAPKKVAKPTPVTSAEIVGLPAEVEAWLERLVYEPKRVYARAYCEFKVGGGAEPESPADGWASKARKRADRVLASV